MKICCGKFDKICCLIIADLIFCNLCDIFNPKSNKLIVFYNSSKSTQMLKENQMVEECEN